MRQRVPQSDQSERIAICRFCEPTLMHSCIDMNTPTPMPNLKGLNTHLSTSFYEEPDVVIADARQRARAIVCGRRSLCLFALG